MKSKARQEQLKKDHQEQLKYEKMRRGPMSWAQVVEKYGTDPYSQTCSFLCGLCGLSNFFPGNREDAPRTFKCVYCDNKITNICGEEGK